MRRIATVAVVAAAAGLAHADIYGDATDDLFDNSFTHLDIASVEVTNDLSWLYINVSNVGDLDATNWGKYGIGIDNGVGASDNSNGWGRNIDWGRGITHWSATWADDGGSGAGGEIYHYDGGWVLDDATYGAGTDISADDSGHAAGVQKWAISLAVLGVGVGDIIQFDVITTGGGADPGVDHLSVNDGSLATPGWGDTSVAGQFSSYTIAPIPTPGTAALLGLGGIAAIRRRR